MSQNKDAVTEIKAALTSGKATQTTTAALQSLLAKDDTSTAIAAPRVGKSRTQSRANDPRSRSTIKNNPRNAAKTASVVVHQDRTPSLSIKDKYTLATEITSLALKTLSQSAIESKTGHGRSQRGESPSTTSRPALDERSANSTPSPAKSKKREQKDGSESGTMAGLQRVAESASMALAYLNSINPSELGLKSLPSLQIESAMASAAGKMLSLGLKAQAANELHMLKRRLEATYGTPSRKAAGQRPASTGKTTLASLMGFEIDLVKNSELSSIAVGHQLLSLQLIISSQDPQAKEAAFQHFSLQNQQSPAHLIVSQVQDTNTSRNRAIKQLQALSVRILELCTISNARKDETVLDTALCPSPLISFKLLVLSLEIRRMWWKLAHHSPNIEKELAEPFRKALVTLQRRSEATVSLDDIYQIVTLAYDRLGLSHAPSSRCQIQSHRILGTMASQTLKSSDSNNWNDRIMRDADASESTCALRAMAQLRRFIAQLSHPESGLSIENIALQAESTLTTDMSGSRHDYDMLLAEVATFVQTVVNVQKIEELLKPLHLCGEFVQRYHRSYPGANGEILRGIILPLLLRCRNPARWINLDSMDILIGSETLAEIARCAEHVGWDVAWSASKTRIALDHSIQAILQGDLETPSPDQPSPVYRDQGLDPAHCLVLLIRYLTHCVGLSANVKHHEPLKRVLPHLVREVYKLDELEKHPVCQAMVEIMISQLQVVCPEVAIIGKSHGCYSEAVLKELQTCSATFSKDLIAGWTISKAFVQGRPTAAQLHGSLSTWHTMLTACKRQKDVEKVICDTKLTRQILQCCGDYLAALGEDAVRLLVLQSLSVLLDFTAQSVNERVKVLLGQAHSYLNLLQSELAGQSLALAQKIADSAEIPPTTQLQIWLGQVEYFIAINRLDKAKEALQSAEQIRSGLEPRRLSRAERVICQRQHAHAWLLHSIVLFKNGTAHDALLAGRRCFKLLNSDWSVQEQRRDESAERGGTASRLESSSFELEGIAAGISKLNLKSKVSPKGDQSGLSCGSPFWTLIPLISRSMLHMSDLYAHHGLFPEADWYSLRAVKLAEEAGTAKFAIRAYAHRTTLLCLAGRIEDAELCVEKARQHNTGQDDMFSTLISVLAEAEVRESEGAYGDALSLYEQSKTLLAGLGDANEASLQPRLELPGTAPITKKPLSSTSTASKTRGTSVRRQATMKPRTTVSSRPARTKTNPRKTVTNEPSSFMFDDLKAQVSLRALSAAARSPPIDALELEQLQSRCQAMWQVFRCRHVQFRHSMNEALATLLSDFTLNVLPESTVSLPGVLKDVSQQAVAGQPKMSKHPGRKIAANGKGVTKKTTDVSSESVEHSFNAALLTAEKSLLTGLASSMQQSSTAATYLESNMLADVTMYRAATAWLTGGRPVNPVTQALYLEQPRIKASQYGAAVGAHESTSEEASSGWQWPCMVEAKSYQSVSPEFFQQEYIDVLPVTWSALSLTMNEDCTELFAVRYRRGESPLTLRLPLSRQNEDQSDEGYDYRKVKEEFDDIIAQSNFSCHNAGDVAAKGGKSRWWLERQALDKRLQSLLVNIENLWFGGFRGIMSGLRAASDAAARFEATMQNILGQHLPSRKANRGVSPGYRFDKQVLELFTGLAKDEDSIYDVDEAITDLLYFVVDILQFSGERNAYDEIDFDRMTLAVADALRAFHDDNNGENDPGAHLVLVLDKRLQALPWENLPSLEGKSVSRVGSMQTLRECILASKLSKSGKAKEELRHLVDPHSGTYILNPSGDLTGTRETIEPALLKMPGDADDDWTSIVNRTPSEEEFTEALSSSKILLYFGHGAGSQYIRPRIIKRQKKCSEVVWLMGCSSGAVTEYGQLEPSAVPLTYLQAGSEAESDRCLSVVATLWDVTDKDIDRFSLETGQRWGLWPAAGSEKLTAKTPKIRVAETEPSTPRRPPKTPKTPKLHRTPMLPTTPATYRGSSRARGPANERMSLAEAVAESREACFLRYLNGAAPVVYGIPVHLGG